MREFLENNDLRVSILPERGGKISSIFDRMGAGELLFQPPQGVYPLLRTGMPFEEGDASGFDDVFPSMGETPDVSDHGWIWTLPMMATRRGNALRLAGAVNGLQYTKVVHLAGNSLHLDWQIENHGRGPLPYIWICHCLWALTKDTRFFCPSRAAVDVLDEKETAVSLPNAPCASGRMSKHYLRHALTDGICGFTRADGLRVTMRFDPAALPWLGLWVTNGGWRGDRNFAWEPATAFFDTQKRAARSGTLRILQPGDKTEFSIVITITHDEKE